MDRTCETCGGTGLIEIQVPHMECCQRAEFECGGRGCTGPIESSHLDQDYCHDCHGTGKGGEDEAESD